MQKKNRMVFVLALLAALIQGCAHTSENKKVDQEVAKSPVKSNQELRQEADKELKTSPGLNEEQRKELMALRDSTREQMDKMRLQSLKLRSVLISTVISPNYDADEVSTVEEKMKDVENKRLSVLFDAVEQANKIMGRTTSSTESNRRIMREMFFEEHSGRE